MMETEDAFMHVALSDQTARKKKPYLLRDGVKQMLVETGEGCTLG